MQQRQGSALKVAVTDEAAEPIAAPTLLLRLEPRHKLFWDNLSDLFRRRRQPPLRLISWPAAPWPDIFVPTRVPWRALGESGALHLVIVAALIWVGALFPHHDLTAEKPTFHKEDLVYYSPSEYLPPLDTGKAHAAQPQKGDVAYAPQPIISVPPEADNHTQTIVTPPDVKLNHDVPLPNIVAWTPTPAAVPIAATTHTNLRTPSLSPEVVAPAPQLNQASRRQAPNLQANVTAPAPVLNRGLQRHALLAPEASVVAPAPQMDAGASTRRVRDVNIGHSDVVAPAPSLPMGEQRTALASSRGALNGGGGPSVAAPAPSVQGLGTSRAGAGQIMSLSVRPAPPSAAATIPVGNRRGTFAADPQGKPNATGTPDVTGGKGQSAGVRQGQGTGNGAGNAANANGVPPGLMVGSGPKDAGNAAVAGGDSEKKLSASLTPASLHGTAKVVPPEKATEIERKVFGARKFYSMTLNLPNLNSSGGSWVLRFAEMGEVKEQGELNGPVATQTTDPAYPLDLMRKNVQGIVTLYAVIHDDGSVGEIRVLDGVNDRLDGYAMTALQRWHFRPATKNGNIVPVEAVVRIPFKPIHY